MKEKAGRREKHDEGDRRLTKCGFQSIAFLRGASNVFGALYKMYSLPFDKYLLRKGEE